MTVGWVYQIGYWFQLESNATMMETDGQNNDPDSRWTKKSKAFEILTTALSRPRKHRQIHLCTNLDRLWKSRFQLDIVYTWLPLSCCSAAAQLPYSCRSAAVQFLHSCLWFRVQCWCVICACRSLDICRQLTGEILHQFKKPSPLKPHI